MWSDDALDLGTDNLRHLAVEQAGGIGHERLVTWMHDAGLKQQRRHPGKRAPVDSSVVA